jgi:hypothetical protein
MSKDKIARLREKFHVEIEEALKISHSKMNQAHKEFMIRFRKAQEELKRNIEIEQLSPQERLNSAHTDITNTLKLAAQTRDIESPQAGDGHSIHEEIDIQFAHEKYARVELFQRLRDDQGQDFEQMHLQSGIDPSYDPDVYCW